MMKLDKKTIEIISFVLSFIIMWAFSYSYIGLLIGAIFAIPLVRNNINIEKVQKYTEFLAPIQNKIKNFFANKISVKGSIKNNKKTLIKTIAIILISCGIGIAIGYELAYIDVDAKLQSMTGNAIMTSGQNSVEVKILDKVREKLNY